MLVTKSDFEGVLAKLIFCEALAFDTETTTIHWWKSPWHPIAPRVFSVQFWTGTEGFYFDFGCSGSGPDALDDSHFKRLNDFVFCDPNKIWVAQNFKFDAHHLKNHGIDIAGTWHCTAAIQRIVNNLEVSLKLDDLGEKYLGENKIDVKSYMRENGLIKKIPVSPFRPDEFEDGLQFVDLPLPMLVEYGIKDTKLTWDLAQFQIKEIERLDAKYFEGDEKRSMRKVMDNERALTKVLFQMERNGIKIDRSYTAKAFETEKAKYEIAKAHLDEMVRPHTEKQIDWLSPKQLKPIFDAMNEPYGFTEKGNACFDKDALEKSEAPLAKKILEYRYHYKRAHTYFENYLKLVDTNDFIHPDYQQGGPQTGRISCWNPNLQNVPKRADKKEKDFPVRRCFTPESGEFFLVSWDYDQMEYRLTLDYAGQKDIIELIQAGLDPHAELGKRLSMDRDAAKTMNFKILYGAGIQAIADDLKTDYNGGKRAKREYFRALPQVEIFLKKVVDTAKIRGYIFTWLGRILKYDRNTSYKAPNGAIQGGCADAMKMAMNQIAPLFSGTKSKLRLQVHDELVASIHRDEIYLVEAVREIMESVYPYKLIKLTAGAAYSKIAWNQLEDGIPFN